MALRAEPRQIAPHGRPSVRRVAYRRVLVPIVDRSVSEQATAIACQLASEKGTWVTALNVVEVPMELPLDAHMEDEELRARHALADARATGDLYGVRIDGQVVRARAAGEAIVEAARNRSSEIIVLSAPRKERSRAKGPPFGKTVDFVLKHAHCRVMVAATRP